MEQLRDRVAVVTGAASGIGLAVTEAFVAEGLRVVMADIDADLLATHAARLASTGAPVLAVPTDVTDAGAVERAATAAVEQYGALHIAVNNAGIVTLGSCWSLPLSEWHRIVDVVLWGAIHGVRAFVPRILATGEEGHVVNVASLAAVTIREGFGPYTVAKHGVLGLTDVLRADLRAEGAPIGASVVLPGSTRTGLNPRGVVGPDVVARNIVDAIRTDRPYVYTDDQLIDEVDARLRTIVEARGQLVE